MKVKSPIALILLGITLMAGIAMSEPADDWWENSLDYYFIDPTDVARCESRLRALGYATHVYEVGGMIVVEAIWAGGDHVTTP
jgi:hypothetical protein